MMWKLIGKGAAALFCLAILAAGVWPLVSPPDYYDINGEEDAAVMKLTPPDLYRRAEAYADLMQRKDIESLKPLTAPEILDNAFYRAIPTIAQYGSIETPQATRVLGFHTNTTWISGSGGKWTDSNIVIAHYYPDKVIFTITNFRQQGEDIKVTSFNLRRLSNADIAAVKFSLWGKSPLHYAVLALAVLILAFSLVTLYASLTRPRVKWRWAWVPFVALGIGYLTFDWGTGAFGIRLLNFHAPQAFMAMELFQYPMILMCLPIGALLFWFKAEQKPLPKAEAQPAAFEG
ncbi:MAG: hypothetical protein QM647_13485 [Asticcacaulis sp.]|uniref:hypothetical protein n=1 Tax=Asticcacaulis sp. TaxID=1872648 RepID=UPI0039E61E38